MKLSRSYLTPHQALDFLRQRYLEKRKLNSRYSLAAFARDLGVSSSFLSRVMAGHRPITVKLAVQIASVCGVSSSEADRWVAEIISRAPATAKISKRVRETFARKRDRMELSPPAYQVERFQVISQWYHLAILNLTYLPDFKPAASWIARRLGITRVEAEDAVARLFGLGLLEEKSGTWLCTENALLVDPRRSEASVREFHRQMSEKALSALADPSPEAYERRLISGVTFSCARSDVPRLKERLKEVQKEFIRFGAESTRPTDVYHLNLQLFPLTRDAGSAEKSDFSPKEPFKKKERK